jgi:hypothetical protein
MKTLNGHMKELELNERELFKLVSNFMTIWKYARIKGSRFKGSS